MEYWDCWFNISLQETLCESTTRSKVRNQGSGEDEKRVLGGRWGRKAHKDEKEEKRKGREGKEANREKERRMKGKEGKRNEHRKGRLTPFTNDWFQVDCTSTAKLPTCLARRATWSATLVSKMVEFGALKVTWSSGLTVSGIIVVQGFRLHTVIYIHITFILICSGCLWLQNFFFLV